MPFVVFGLTRAAVTVVCSCLCPRSVTEVLTALQNPFAKLLQGHSELCPGRRELWHRVLSPWLLLAVSSTSGVCWQGSLLRGTSSRNQRQIGLPGVRAELKELEI